MSSVNLAPLAAATVALCTPVLGQYQAPASSGPSFRPADLRFVPGQVIVRTHPGVDVQEIAAAAGGVVLGGAGDSTYLIQLPPGSGGGTRPGSHPGTAWSEGNALLSPPEHRACQSSSGGVGGQGGCTIAFYDGEPRPERYYEQPTADIIDVALAQELSLGIPSLVAVVDTGVDPDHVAFAGRVYSPGYDFIREAAGAWDTANGLDDDGDGLVDEAWGHGTHVAGIIALINPDAWILPLRVLDSDGNGTAFDVARAIHTAVDQGADVINLSLGMTGYSQAVADALERAHDAEATVIASAGNTSGGLLFPAKHDRAAAVVALDGTDTKADFSSYGPNAEFSAPGVEIYSAMPGNSWAWWSGTSMAAAVASGSVSLLHSIHGDPLEAEGDDAIEVTAVNVDVQNPSYTELLGDGRIDLAAAAMWIVGNP